MNDFDQKWDLSQLPSKIKTDIVQWNQKMSKPIVGNTFVHLLSPDLLHLNAQLSIDDQILDSIANNCKHLIEFRCSHQKNTFTEAGFINFVHRMRHIQTFYVEHSNIMNDAIVEVMRIKWPKLRSLHLIHCPKITTKCSQSLREMPLIELSLTKTSVRIFSLFMNFGLYFYFFFLEKCKKFPLESIFQIDDEFLNDLKYSALAKNLKDICLRDCKVTSDGLKDLDWNVLENINIFGIPLTGIRMDQFHIFWDIDNSPLIQCLLIIFNSYC